MTQFGFAKIYAKQREIVWRLVSRYISLREDKEDLFQEVFLNIHKALPRFRGQAAISTWIYRIAVNTAINYLKKQNRYRALKNIFNNLWIIETEEPKEIEELSFFAPLEALNPQQKMVLVLSDIEDKKLEEISETMNLPLGTVKSTLHRAREIVKKELRKNA